MLTNAREVKTLQRKYNTYSHYVVSRFTGSFRFSDSLTLPFFLIDEFRAENSKAYLSSNLPVLLIILDSINDAESAFDYLVEF